MADPTIDDEYEAIHDAMAAADALADALQRVPVLTGHGRTTAGAVLSGHTTEIRHYLEATHVNVLVRRNAARDARNRQDPQRD